MQQNNKAQLVKASRVFNIITLIGCLIILATLSFEIIHNDDFVINALFLRMQIVICITFLIDFALRFSLSDNKPRFVLYNWVLLVVAIPILNIIIWFNIDVSSKWYLIYRLAPMIRGFYGLIMVVRLITRRGIVSLMVSYIATVLVFTYCASLMFYSVEHQLNPELTSFGEAIWWAWMNVTTVGANIYAKTAIGKVLTVLLSSLGMMMFPIFTAFIIDQFKLNYSSRRRRNKAEEQQKTEDNPSKEKEVTPKSADTKNKSGQHPTT